MIIPHLGFLVDSGRHGEEWAGVTGQPGEQSRDSPCWRNPNSVSGRRPDDGLAGIGVSRQCPTVDASPHHPGKANNARELSQSGQGIFGPATAVAGLLHLRSSLRHRTCALWAHRVAAPARALPVYEQKNARSKRFFAFFRKNISQKKQLRA